MVKVMDSGATGSLRPVKGVSSVGMNYRGGETGGGTANAKEMDKETGTNKGPMNAGKTMMEGGRRSHMHGMPGDRVHDQHIKSSGGGKTHMSEAVAHLKKTIG